MVRLMKYVCKKATQSRMCRRCPACPKDILEEWKNKIVEVEVYENV